MNLQAYEKERGFDEGTFDKYHIYLDGDVIMIPTLSRHGAWFDRTHRPDGQPKYTTPKGGGTHLYNPQGWGPNTKDIWIAEGEFDTISLLEAGVPAVGILGTNAFWPEWRYMFEKAEVVLALDSDEAGTTRANKLAALWPEGQTSRFDPSPHADLNDWYRDDREEFRRTVLAW